MFVCDFEVLKDEVVVASKRSIALPDVSAAWPKIASLAKAIDEPGYKIRVKDSAGRIVILIGVAALRLHADAVCPAPSTPLRAKLESQIVGF
jgi:hypothetical protein